MSEQFNPELTQTTPASPEFAAPAFDNLYRAANSPNGSLEDAIDLNQARQAVEAAQTSEQAPVSLSEREIHEHGIRYVIHASRNIAHIREQHAPETV